MEGFGPRVAAAVVLLGALAFSGSAPLRADARTVSREGGAPWAWPLAPVTVVAPYAAPATPYGAGHRGIDLRSSPGVPVSAPADGVVWFAGVVVDRPVVTIDHGDGVLSSYEPLASTLRAGDSVQRGAVIGSTAEGGHCASVCLHVGVRIDGEYVSPLLFFSRVPRAVLLPLYRGTAP